MNPQMERILAQSQGGGGDLLAGRILEINPDHALIAKLALKANADGVSDELEDLAHLAA